LRLVGLTIKINCLRCTPALSGPRVASILSAASKGRDNRSTRDCTESSCRLQAETPAHTLISVVLSHKADSRSYYTSIRLSICTLLDIRRTESFVLPGHQRESLAVNSSLIVLAQPSSGCAAQCCAVVPVGRLMQRACQEGTRFITLEIQLTTQLDRRYDPSSLEYGNLIEGDIEPLEGASTISRAGPDRDSYVKIALGVNVIASEVSHEHNFSKRSSSQVGTFGLRYDFGSQMHYSEYAFSKNGQKTIVPLPGKVPSGVKIGQRDRMSTNDRKQSRACGDNGSESRTLPAQRIQQLAAHLLISSVRVPPPKLQLPVMSVSYGRTIMNSQQGGAAFRILFLWEGSIYKLIAALSCLIYIVLYSALSLTYRLALAPAGRQDFERIVKFCLRRGTERSHYRFLLAFFVSGRPERSAVAFWPGSHAARQLKSPPAQDDGRALQLCRSYRASRFRRSRQLERPHGAALSAPESSCRSSVSVSVHRRLRRLADSAQPDEATLNLRLDSWALSQICRKLQATSARPKFQQRGSQLWRIW
uniref:Bestrophin homolog n=1 Tax=Macrostomum lignano TaxID=282301 RepID=A0A1I8JP01_9PLAT